MARVTWIVKGKLKVGQLPTNLRPTGESSVPLSGVTVKIYAK